LTDKKKTRRAPAAVHSLLAGVLILGEPFALPMLPAVIAILFGVRGVQRFADKQAAEVVS